MTANHKHTEESLRQDTALALSAGSPAEPPQSEPDLVGAFEEVVANLAKGERWSCACGTAYRFPDPLPNRARRALWLRFVSDHDKHGCRVEVAPLSETEPVPTELLEARVVLADLRARIANAINLCEGARPSGSVGGTLAAEVVHILSTPQIVCGQCSRATGGSQIVIHQAPECSAP